MRKILRLTLGASGGPFWHLFLTLKNPQKTVEKNPQNGIIIVIVNGVDPALSLCASLCHLSMQRRPTPYGQTKGFYTNRAFSGNYYAQKNRIHTNRTVGGNRHHRGSDGNIDAGTAAR